MPTLTFTVNPQAVGQLSEILACLVRFNEDISLEATQSALRISSLNISKTAHACFALSGNGFFDRYYFGVSEQQRGSSTTQAKIWTCKLQNRALAAVFRRRTAADGMNREKDTGLQRCEFELQADGDLPECRLVIRLICNLGVVKTYRLTYESGEILHATFDRAKSLNAWAVSSKTLADVVEYFGPKTEQLDWYLQDNKVTFTSYTEKVVSGREVLKQPMHTSVALEKRDFEECLLEEGLHIGIVVKDFRAIVAHADSLQAVVKARYSRGNRPMQITYSLGGITSEFTLMTRGLADGPGAPTASTPARNLSVHPRGGSASTTQAASAANAQSDRPPDRDTMPSARQDSIGAQAEVRRPITPPATAASLNPDSLFIPTEDDEHQWDEPNYDEEPDVVMWDASAQIDPATSIRRIRDSEQNSFATVPERQQERVQEIAPTQRLSQIKGLFD